MSSSKLGRNPFQKKSALHVVKESGFGAAKAARKFNAAMPVAPEKVETPVVTSSSTRLRVAVEKSAEWMLCDVPAQVYLLGLKTVLLAREVFARA
ncbi:MAG: hypothetical protein ACXWPM_00525 [Bdellovibrionota bacterium]